MLPRRGRPSRPPPAADGEEESSWSAWRPLGARPRERFAWGNRLGFVYLLTRRLRRIARENATLRRSTRSRARAALPAARARPVAGDVVCDGHVRGDGDVAGLDRCRGHFRDRVTRVHVRHRRADLVAAADDLADSPETDAERVRDRARLQRGFRDGLTHRLRARLGVVPQAERYALQLIRAGTDARIDDLADAGKLRHLDGDDVARAIADDARLLRLTIGDRPLIGIHRRQR